MDISCNEFVAVGYPTAFLGEVSSVRYGQAFHRTRNDEWEALTCSILAPSLAHTRSPKINRPPSPAPLALAESAAMSSSHATPLPTRPVEHQCLPRPCACG